MLNRLKGVLILLPLLLVIILGGTPLYIASAILSIIGIREFYSAFKTKDVRPLNTLSYIFILGLLITNIFNISSNVFLVFSIVVFIALASSTILLKRNIVDVTVTVFGLVYVALPFQMIVISHKLNSITPNITWLIFIIAFSTDIFAYLSGRYFGKHKLIPSVSPNKTIEGSLGGILGASISAFLFCLVFKLKFYIFIPLAFIGSILAQIGDLFASSIKRYTGLKDFGNLIPGHGGIIDRFDSIFFVSALFFAFTILCS